MRQVTVKIQGRAPYSSSRAHEDPLLKGENKVAYEERTWASRAHIQDGKFFIPPMAFKMAVDRAAKMIGRQIPGKGKSTYTKFFECGVIVTDPIFIADEKGYERERVYVNSDGVRGSGKRVWRSFPRIDEWSCDVTFYVIADEVTQEVFEEAVRYAGVAVGVGRFRPERGGYFGRFEVTGIKWH